MLTFKKFEINSCGGINKEHPIVIDFSEFNKGKRIGKVSGDQGAGKTSFINALLYACGHEFGFKTDNLVNNKDKTLNIQTEFSYGKSQYRIQATKTMFRLLKLYKDDEGNEVWKAEDEPKTLVRKIIGNIGVSPMPLKENKGKDQVSWLYSMLNVPKEVLEKEAKLNEGLKEVTEARKVANREYESIKKVLSQSELYLNWEQSEKKYKEVKTIEDAKAKLDKATAAKSTYNQAAIEIGQLQARTLAIEEEIEDLEMRLQSKRIELAKTKERIENGEKYLASNKDVIQKFDDAQSEFMGISEYLAAKKEWDRVQQQKKEMDELETLVARADTKKDGIRELLRNLVADVLPPIDGLEVVTEESIDGKPIGVYVNGKTMAQLSESELYQFAFQIWTKNNPSMVFIENIGVLGSNAIATLNELAKSGSVYVWATELVRGQDEIKFEFIESIK